MAAVKDWGREAWGGTGGREERKGSEREVQGRGRQGARESGEWGHQRDGGWERSGIQGLRLGVGRARMDGTVTRHQGGQSGRGQRPYICHPPGYECQLPGLGDLGPPEEAVFSWGSHRWETEI